MTEEQAALKAFEMLSQQSIGQIATSFHYDYDKPGVITILFLSAQELGSAKGSVANSIEIDDIAIRHRFELVLRTGPRIDPALGRLDEIDAEAAMSFPTEGGDVARIEGSNFFGTVGIAVSRIRLEAATRAGARYVCEGDRAFLSNNHVIADYDRAAIGTALRAGTGTSILGSFFPMRDILLHFDFALGINLSQGSFIGGTIRGLGSVSQVIRNPAANGESIRKVGARTGLSSGRTVGRTSIRSSGYQEQQRWFNGVYKTTQGFGRGGDSGSIVVSDSMDILGLYSWSDREEEAPFPTNFGYFFTLGPDQYPIGDGPSVAIEYGSPSDKST